MNAVGPGPIYTPFLARRLAASGETAEQGTMLKRPGRAEEVTAAILFLASDVTGALLFVDGDMTAMRGEFNYYIATISPCVLRGCQLRFAEQGAQEFADCFLRAVAPVDGPGFRAFVAFFLEGFSAAVPDTEELREIGAEMR